MNLPIGKFLPPVPQFQLKQSIAHLEDKIDNMHEHVYQIGPSGVNQLNHKGESSLNESAIQTHPK
jgi:hypothetical protein